MGKIGNAIAGATISAVIAAGSYAGEMYHNNRQFDALSLCRTKLAGQALRSCVEDAHNVYGDGSLLLGVTEFVGVAGVVLNGWIGYKAVKEANDTTGLMTDINRA